MAHHTLLLLSTLTFAALCCPAHAQFGGTTPRPITDPFAPIDLPPGWNPTAPARPPVFVPRPITDPFAPIDLPPGWNPTAPARPPVFVPRPITDPFAPIELPPTMPQAPVQITPQMSATILQSLAQLPPQQRNLALRNVQRSMTPLQWATFTLHVQQFSQALRSLQQATQNRTPTTPMLPR